MKAIYLLLLITLVSSENVFFCLLKNEKIMSQAMTIIESIKTMDLGNIFNKLVEIFPLVKDDVLACFNGEPKLKIIDCCHQYFDRPLEYRSCQERYRRLHIVC